MSLHCLLLLFLHAKITSAEPGAHSREEGENGVKNAPDDPEKMEGEEEEEAVTGKPEDKPEAMESYFSSGDFNHSQISLVRRAVPSTCMRRRILQLPSSVYIIASIYLNHPLLPKNTTCPEITRLAFPSIILCSVAYKQISRRATMYI